MRKTLAIGLTATAVFGGLWLGVVSWREAVTLNSGATFSEVLTWIWAMQPWVIFLPAVVLAYLTGFFHGHWFGVPSRHLDAIRNGIKVPPAASLALLIIATTLTPAEGAGKSASVAAKSEASLAGDGGGASASAAPCLSWEAR